MLNLAISIQNIALFLTSIITAYLSFYIIRDKVKYSNVVFSLFILSVGMWALGIAFFDISENSELINWIVKGYYVAAAAIPLFFSLFSLSFPIKNKHIKIFETIFILSFLSLVSLIVFYPGFIFKNIIVGVKNTIVIDFPSYIVYLLYFVFLILISYIFLIKSFFIHRNDLVLKKQIKYIIVGTLIPFLFGMFFNLILPLYSYDYIWIGPIFGLIVVCVVLYSIYKFNLFNTKIIFAEFFTFIICLIMLIKAITTDNLSERTINIGVFVVITFFGVLLIQSIRKESTTSEKIKKLADDLVRSNIKLEKTNLHLKELDQKKSEFVSLASHQIRGPLTSIKGYISLLHDEDLGPITNQAKEALEVMQLSCTTLATVVNDYLDVSRIEQGKMHYDFTNVDMRQLVKECMTELAPSFTRANLVCINNIPIEANEEEFDVRADRTKLKQVIMNIIDNSIKYTPAGSVSVTMSKTNNEMVRVEIKDTGVGITAEVMPKLFIKFSRAPDASEANILGTGLGLFIAKAFVEAHEGHLWAESQGAGKGSTFIIELKGM